NNKGNVILEQNCWFGHPQIRPGNNDTILFCHEGPGNLIDARLWLINSDGSNRRCAREKSENELVTTHEFWLRDGSKFGFMYREKDQKTFLKFINPDTLEENTLMECSHYLHFISNREGSMITGDGDSFIYIIDVANKKEEKLCFHGSHWKSYGNTQDSHPHPCFTPDSMSVLFTSDKDGLPSIYKVDL
ncbi:MAG TPA: oligogalacturonate lyase, partial [Clostridiaceae bacterium]|nr:oligogalacturonate lyase [Clostridiaceae bacterium]